MNYPAGPSPAWLGVTALAGFAALVLAAFASGYHLVGGDAPAAGDAIGVPSAAHTAIVRERLPPDRGVIRVSPDDSASIVARLPSGLAVTVLAEKGDYARIRYERQGESYEGWTPASNLASR